MGENMDRNFRGISANLAIARLASAPGLIAMAVTTQVRMVSTSISLILCASFKGKRNMQGRFRYIYWPT